MVIRQGEIYWLDLGPPKGSGPAFRRPCVVVQNDAFNGSRISTTVVAVVTSHLGLGRAFGNVTLKKGEAGLRRKSVVNVSQLTTVDKRFLFRRIGSLTSSRLDEVIRGIVGVIQPLYGAAEPEERDRTLREVAALRAGRLGTVSRPGSSTRRRRR